LSSVVAGDALRRNLGWSIACEEGQVYVIGRWIHHNGNSS